MMVEDFIVRAVVADEVRDIAWECSRKPVWHDSLAGRLTDFIIEGPFDDELDRLGPVDDALDRFVGRGDDGAAGATFASPGAMSRPPTAGSEPGSRPSTSNSAAFKRIEAARAAAAAADGDETDEEVLASLEDDRETVVSNSDISSAAPSTTYA